MDAPKLVFSLIRDFITDYNLYQWDLARRERRKPELLPSLVGVDEVITREDLVVGDLLGSDHREVSRHMHLVVHATYRLYYSRRSPGGGTHRFDLGRQRQGRIIFDKWESAEGKDHKIEFPEINLKVET